MGPRGVVVLFAALIFPFVSPVAGATATTSTSAQSLGTRVMPSPGGSSVVPQAQRRRGQHGYNIVPVSQFHPAVPSTSTGGAFFRGGRTSTASTATSPVVPRSVSAPSAPKFSAVPGLNQPGMNAAGIQSTPPDSTGAIGPNYYVEMVNSRITVYNRNLGVVSSYTFQAFLGQNSLVLCDPQIQWDPAASRWLYSILWCNTASSAQAIFFGWSRTTDASNLSTAGWCQFVFGNDPFLLDFQKLGHNGNYMIIGGNLYDETTPSTNPPFVSAGIEWASLPANGDTTCATPSSSGGSALPMTNGDGSTPTFTPVPVNTDDASANGYIVSAYDPSGSNNGQLPAAQNKIATWHLDSAGVLHQDNDVTVNTYGTPNPVPQPGTGGVLDSLAGQLTQAVGNPAQGFYTQHTVNGPGGRTAVNWYEFMAVGSTVTLVQQGQVSNATEYVFNAAISPRFDGQGAAIIYNRASATAGHFPVIAAQIRYLATAPGTMAAGELVLASSTTFDGDFSCTAPYGPPCRWGDYSGATPDPLKTNLVWGTSEFNTASGSTPAWADENFAIAPDREPITQSTPAGSPPARLGVNPSTTGTPPHR